VIEAVEDKSVVDKGLAYIGEGFAYVAGLVFG